MSKKTKNWAAKQAMIIVTKTSLIVVVGLILSIGLAFVVAKLNNEIDILKYVLGYLLMTPIIILPTIIAFDNAKGYYNNSVKKLRARVARKVRISK